MAGKKKPRIISLENVKQILQWGPLVAKRDPATGRAIKLVTVLGTNGKAKVQHTVAAPCEVVPVDQQFLVPDPTRRGQTWAVFVAELERL
ncbi:hypothetical protein PST407_04907 [Pseudomonas syringae pv. tomato]|uniref:C-5 cytosine-specific DNA methylase n=1 Tax=Pseudomonas syringae pv. tomato TaxID=323 RepID=A0AAV1BN36_PSEUB|nr:hypothetical protein PST407_04907 [Pseudomonas syringae pv. tomato]KUR43843.1 hypothetical protein PSTA9_03039 [Pseudomonas syringae pv. tomato]CAI8903832.1 C-5 cytosine-specific DNA methylase [Pseudomonas syringae pv. tomato]